MRYNVGDKVTVEDWPDDGGDIIFLPGEVIATYELSDSHYGGATVKMDSGEIRGSLCQSWIHPQKGV